MDLRRVTGLLPHGQRADLGVAGQPWQLSDGMQAKNGVPHLTIGTLNRPERSAVVDVPRVSKQ